MSYEYDEEEFDTPQELQAMRARMTWEERVRTFAKVFGRNPGSDEELEMFIEEYTLELYNSGMDHESDFDPSL
ncbi:MAG: hypothetical protein KDA79_18405 [Planctomycetaceae bacterium]|nr:hypothetical protein [Planctomycetaceae bacterium]